MIFLLILIALEVGLVAYFLYYSLILPQLEQKRKIWAKVEANFRELENNK